MEKETNKLHCMDCGSNRVVHTTNAELVQGKGLCKGCYDLRTRESLCENVGRLRQYQKARRRRNLGNVDSENNV